MKSAFRSLIVAGLITSLVAGCGRAPMTATGLMAATRSGTVASLSAPISLEAMAEAAHWQPDATQVGVSIAHADGGDVATYVFASPSKQGKALLVSNHGAGYTTQELALSGPAIQGLGQIAPLSNQAGALLDSTTLFAKAQAAGLPQGQAIVVLNSRVNGQIGPVAVVVDQTGQNSLMLDAHTGQALGPAAPIAQRTVMMGELIVGFAAVYALGMSVCWVVKKIADALHHAPAPAPSAFPSTQPVPPSPGPSVAPQPQVSFNISRIDGGNVLLNWQNVDVTTPINGQAPTGIKVFLQEQPNWSAIHTLDERSGFGLFTLPPGLYHFGICATANGVDGPIQATGMLNDGVSAAAPGLAVPATP